MGRHDHPLTEQNEGLRRERRREVEMTLTTGDKYNIKKQPVEDASH